MESRSYSNVSLSGPIPLVGLPDTVNIPGRGQTRFGPSLEARELAAQYAAASGLDYSALKVFTPVVPERAARIAKSYDLMVSDPLDAAVKASYRALIDETLAQYEFFKMAGIKTELIKGLVDPYFASPRLAILDVLENRHLWVYQTKRGTFGSGSVDLTKNLLLESTDQYIDGVKLLANDVFRIVHDYFGHIKEGLGFRADGEENAWRSHSTMYSRNALGAMTSELRGQNSWVNYGPYGDHNRRASPADTIYADQKNGLLPKWAWDEGRRDP